MFENLQESLEYEEEFSEQDARSIDKNSPRTMSTVRSDVHRPDRQKMQDNWELYKNFGLVRASIRGFASEVISPGYYVDAENEQVREDLEEWLAECAVISGEHDKDFREIVKKSTIQREVRGTALIEKVPSKEGGLYGFKLVNPENVKAYTKPNQAILLEPDEDIDRLAERHDNFKKNSVKKTPDGEVAAYVQWDSKLNLNNDKSEIAFTKDDIIKLTRDEDVGEIWGNSRLNSIRDRVNALLQKLDNNDDAIKATAHPFWLFKMGQEDDPWTEDEIKEFMKNHKGEQFQPGMKQAVQGNVDIDTVGGEVAEIEEFLDFDVDMIMSEMPIPKYALGAFEENVNQFVSRSQETELRKQVNEARKEIESEFTAVLKEKADKMGHSRDSVNGLVIGVPPEERVVPEEGEEGAQEGSQQPQNRPDEPASNQDPETDHTRPPASSEMSESIWTDEELSEHYNPWTSDETDKLQVTTEQYFREVREALLNELSRREGLFKGQGPSQNKLGNLIDRTVNQTTQAFDFKSSATDVFEEAIEDEYEHLQAEGLGIPNTLEERKRVKTHSEDYRNSVMDFVSEFAREVRTEFRRGLNRGEGADVAVERVRDKFNDDMISQRAGIISMMEVHNARQNARLSEFEKADNVVGYRVEAESPSSKLTETLDGTEVFFEEGDYSEQIADQVPASLFPKGWYPPSSTPPFRFGDTSGIVPVFEEETND